MKTREDILRAIEIEKAAVAEAVRTIKLIITEGEENNGLRSAQVQDPNFNFPNRVNPPAAVPAPSVVAPTPVVAAPVVPAAPVVVTTAGPDLHGWANNGLLGLISGLLAWIGLKKQNVVVAGATPDESSKVSQIIAHISGASLIGDPALRATVDAALARAVQSGVPGTAIQTALGFIPGVGPIASQLEPMLRGVVVKVLQERAGTNADPIASANAPAMLDKVADLIKLVKGVGGHSSAQDAADRPIAAPASTVPSADVVQRFDRLESTIARIAAQLQAKAATVQQ
jgi:hypothetical protein